MSNGKWEAERINEIFCLLKGVEEAEIPLRKSQELGQVAKIGKEIEDGKYIG